MPNYGSTGTKNATVPHATVPKLGSTGGGAFVKPANLVGCLVIIDPLHIDRIEPYVPKGQEKAKDAGLKDRMVADVVSLAGDVKGEYPGVWWTQSLLVREGKRILNITDQTREHSEEVRKTGNMEQYLPDGPKLDEVLAGRLLRKPKKDFLDVFPTPAALEEAFAKNAKMVPNNSYTWTVETLNEADRELVVAYYTSGRELPETEDEDPYAD